MTLIITHSGQTGVERGADRAARMIDIPVEGICAFEGRDEIASLPPEIAADLRPCPRKGARQALTATLTVSNALVIAVPNAEAANTVIGIEPLRRFARAKGIPLWIVDPISNLDEVAREARRLAGHRDTLRVMITGPRSTRWRDGERFGFRVVGTLADVAAPDVTYERSSSRSMLEPGL